VSLPKQQGDGFQVRARVPFNVVNAKLNADEYLKLIKEVIEPELEALDHNLTFMQDNVNAHKAKTVVDYLAEKYIQTLPWPSQSPDLNPIETICAINKQKLYSEFSFPKTKDELIDRVFKIRMEISSHTLENLCNAILHRFRAVVAAKGEWFKK
jgi:hypothetical protein